MSSPSSRRTVAVAAVVFGIIINLGVSCNGFREDEIECEQAISHIQACCPGFRAKEIDCSYSDRIDCNDNVTGAEYPALSIEDSECLQNKTCAQLIDNGDCTRAQAAKKRVTSVPSTDGGARPNSSAPTPGPSKVCKARPDM